MTDRTLRRIIAKGKKRRAGKQSDAYRWLRARHAPMTAVLRTDPPSWEVIAAEMSSAGVKGGKSRPLTDRAVKRIWLRVCRDMVAEAGLRATGVRVNSVNRSTGSAIRQPQQVSPSQPSPPTVSGEGAPVHAQASGETGMTVGQARLAAIRQALNERSGR